MRHRIVVAPLLALALIGPATPAHARGWHRAHVGWHVGIGWSPWWWYGSWYWPGYPWWAYGPGWAYPHGYVPARGLQGEVSNLTVVKTDVEPEHARVLLNGQLIGVADDFDGYPDFLYLEPGKYTLEFRLQGYKSDTIDVDAHSGLYLPVEMKLERIPGEKAAPWWDRPKGLPVARVFGPAGGGEKVAPKPYPDLSLRPELRSGSGRTAAGGQGEQAMPAPAASGAALDLRVTPPNASVYLDGAFLGTGEELGRLERGVAVKKGHHRLEVMAPGRSPKTIEIDVKSNERQQIVVELESGLDKPKDRT